MFLEDNGAQLSSTSKDEVKTITIPNIIYDTNNPEQVKALEYTYNGKSYYLSNHEGHKVYSQDKRNCRPMTKREFKRTCTEILEHLENYGSNVDLILSQLEQLDFGIGHANSTFEIVMSCMGLSEIGTLVLNIGTARYLYNQDANTVFHIDHSKLINGTMLKSPEKDEIINIITSSKTMTKKINQVLNSSK